MTFDPFADFSRLRSHIDRMLDESQPAGQKPGDTGNRVWRPPVDLLEGEEALTLKLDLPGIDRESLDIQLAGEELVVRGTRTFTAPQDGGCVHSERPYGQFHRAFRIGIPVQHDAVDAQYRDGVLTVRLPKAETVRPRKIAVKADSEG
jgi:HSP20 family protein